MLPLLLALLAGAAPSEVAGVARVVEALDGRGGRADLGEVLGRLSGPGGARPGVILSDESLERPVRTWLLSADGPAPGTPLASLGEAGCTVAVARGDDLVWTWSLVPGARCLLRDDEARERALDLGVRVGPVVGNQGAGGRIGVHALHWTDRTYGLGGRVWTLAEVAPDQRRAVGLEAVGAVAADPGFVEIAVGAATVSEVRTLCYTDGSCTEDARDLVGPTVSGTLGVRLLDGEGWDRRAWTLGVRAGSIPGRGYSVGLVLGAAWWRRAVGPRPAWAK